MSEGEGVGGDVGILTGAVGGGGAPDGAPGPVHGRSDGAAEYLHGTLDSLRGTS